MKTAQEIRIDLAKKFGLSDAKDVRCYHCSNWGYNCGKVMNSMCESRCMLRSGRTGKDAFTASFQYCRGFNYVGDGNK